jgi:hypothetical protein
MVGDSTPQINTALLLKYREFHLEYSENQALQGAWLTESNEIPVKLALIYPWTNFGVPLNSSPSKIREIMEL